MNEGWGYLYGIAVFGLAVVLSGVAVIYGSQCCAVFSLDEQIIRANFGIPEQRGIRWLTSALMDWPMGFRPMFDDVDGFAHWSRNSFFWILAGSP